jgi:hypothetical protein
VAVVVDLGQLLQAAAAELMRQARSLLLLAARFGIASALAAEIQRQAAILGRIKHQTLLQQPPPTAF